MAARNIEIEFDTGDFFIVTLARQTAAPQATTQVTPPNSKTVMLRVDTGVRISYMER